MVDVGQKSEVSDLGQAAVCEFSDDCTDPAERRGSGDSDKAQKTVRTTHTVELIAVGVMHFAFQKKVKHLEQHVAVG